MVEKVLTEKESIILELKALNESQTKSDSPMLLRKLDHKRIIEKSVEAAEIGRMSNPVIVEFGGLRGATEEVIRKQHPGKEFEYVNMDYSKELKKSGGIKVLSDMTNTPLKGSSVDVVFIMNMWFGTDSLRQKVEECPSGTEGRDELLKLLKNMSDLQERIASLEGIRVLKKDGRLVVGGVADKEEFQHMNSSDDFTGTGNLERLNGVYRDTEKGSYFIVFAYTKINDIPLEKTTSDERERLGKLFEELKTYEAEGGLLWKMRKERRL